jgi:hypothetical protein
MKLRWPERVLNKGRRMMASHLVRRPMALRSDVPIVSFTFDDAPRTAFDTGGRILEAQGVRGTYYLCLGLLSTESEVGPIAGPAEIERAVDCGHELGCHTFDHLDAWHSSPSAYVESIDKNRLALNRLWPAHAFRSFAYPKSGASWRVKPAMRERFACCRGGGQTFNAGGMDLNLLKACFIDRRARMDPAALHSLIAHNAQQRGWLIFAAHDISDDETGFSCRAALLEMLVRHSLDSGATVLPVAAAFDRLAKSAAGPTAAVVAP